MSEPSHPTPPATPDPVNDRKPGRSKRVLVGAALVAAGLAAGGGVTYAATSQLAPTSGTSTVQPGSGPGAPGDRGPRGGGQFGVPPGGLPDGSVPSTQPSTQPSQQTEGST